MKLLCSFLLVCVAFASFCAGQELRPFSEQEVLRFLETQQMAEKSDLSKYLISERLTDDQKIWLEQRLRKQHSVRYHRAYKYDVVEVRSDGELGVALVSVKSRLNPFFEEIFRLAFCRIGGQWLSTPLDGSFIYTGFGAYDRELVSRGDRLVSWGRDKLSKLRASYSVKSEREYRVQIEARRKEDLLDASRERVLAYFIEACKSKDVLAVLACVDSGGEARSSRHDIIRAFSNSDSNQQWEILLKHQFLYSVLPDIRGSDIVSLGMYFPFHKKHSQQIIEFKFRQRKGEWYIELPHYLQMSEEGSFRNYSFRSSNLHSKNQARLLDVKDIVLSEVKSSPSDSLDEVFESFEKAVNSNNLSRYVELVSLSDRGKKFNLSQWKKFTGDSVEQVLRIFEKTGDDQAYLVYLVKVWPRIERYTTVGVRFLRDETGWFVSPTNVDFKELEAVFSEEIVAGVESFRQQVHLKAVERLLPDSLELSELEIVRVPATQEPLNVYRHYEESLVAKNLVRASRGVALGDKTAAETLKSIGADARGRLREDCKFEWQQCVPGSGVSIGIVRLVYSEQGTVEYLLYPFVHSREGVRIVPAHLFYYEHGRGQVIQNRKTLKLVKEVGLEGYEDAYLEVVELAKIEIERILKQDKGK
jgi:hypothetical protein